MTGKLLSDVSDTDDMNADEVMMVFHSLSLTHSLTPMLAYYFTLSYSIVSHSLEHNALLYMVCHHCCRVDAIAGARYSLTSYGGYRRHRSHR